MVHALASKALTDANRFKILPADWGFILWRQSDHYLWKWRPLAQMNDKTALEDIACERLAKLTE
jgi:hypothetical protein